MKRRDVLKGLSLLPLSGSTIESVFASDGRNKIDWFSANSGAKGPLKIGPQVYQSIGVEPIINCRGTFTIIGASIVLPEVREAMEHAHRYNVQLDELAFGVGQRLAELSGAEWGLVSCGCAGGIKIVTAACVSGGNPEKLMYIPLKTMSMEKNEVIIPTSSRTVYDHAVRNIGVKIVQVDTLDQLAKAINPRTAMIYMKGGNPNDASGPGAITVANVSKIAKAEKVPVFVDAAAEKLTLNPNVHLAAGATVVGYSGGKSICGPQSAGLLLGNKALLMSAWQASAPHHGPARDNKVGREEQIGMLAAIEAWASRDHAAEDRITMGWIENISKRVSGIDSVQVTVRAPSSLTIAWDPLKLKITGVEVADELATNSPRVAIGGGSGGNARGSAIPSETGGNVREGGGGNAVAIPANMTSVSLNVSMMGPGNDKIVGDRIYEILSRKRAAPKPGLVMKAPAATLNGRWNVTVDFFNSTSQHKFFIEQQAGNWLEGSHTGEYSTRDLIGTIDGNQVKFYSYYKAPDDPNSFGMTFYGTLDGDTITGDIDMGEYVTAKFSAKRYTYPERKIPVNVPLTRPLSS